MMIWKATLHYFTPSPRLALRKLRQEVCLIVVEHLGCIWFRDAWKVFMKWKLLGERELLDEVNAICLKILAVPLTASDCRTLVPVGKTTN